MKKIFRLPRQEFLAVVKTTPLVSLDLLVQDRQGRVLLGMRKNEPARGFWFVPGGRIMKDEALAAAFERILDAELGLRACLPATSFATDRAGEGRLLGIFQPLRSGPGP